jgi:hypothetical protein
MIILSLKLLEVRLLWSAVFEARNRVGIDRIQFAQSGMYAHINHDLPFALEQTNEQHDVDPDHRSPKRSDFKEVNNIREAVLPRALEFLAYGNLRRDSTGRC